jgi:hypothetical protein
MRLSHGKINHITNLVMDHLRTDPQVEFFSDDNEIRMEIVRIISEELKDDEIIDVEVRRKIESQRRDIPEGSEEWEILYRKYYDEEMTKRRKAIP